MRSDLKYPTLKAVYSVLEKLGVDPGTRYSEQDQDYEYTTCVLEELEQYIDLYTQPETTDEEKRLLGCYFLECLNEHIGNYGEKHIMQNFAFELLNSDIEIHETEWEYWSTTPDSNEENWWHITKHIREWKNT